MFFLGWTSFVHTWSGPVATLYTPLGYVRRRLHYTAVYKILHRAINHMKDQQIYFSGWMRFVYSCLDLICEIWMQRKNWFSITAVYTILYPAVNVGSAVYKILYPAVNGAYKNFYTALSSFTAGYKILYTAVVENPILPCIQISQIRPRQVYYKARSA